MIETPQFKSWFAGCQKIVADHYANEFPTLIPDVLVVTEGKRYIKIVSQNRQTVNGQEKLVNKSVWAFVDKTTGDVLKPASWAAPAKHARGNLNDATNGLALMGPYGPAYLRG